MPGFTTSLRRPPTQTSEGASGSGAIRLGGMLHWAGY
jgi:hypothetical protein